MTGLPFYPPFYRGFQPSLVGPQVGWFQHWVPSDGFGDTTWQLRWMPWPRTALVFVDVVLVCSSRISRQEICCLRNLFNKSMGWQHESEIWEIIWGLLWWMTGTFIEIRLLNFTVKGVCCTDPMFRSATRTCCHSAGTMIFCVVVNLSGWMHCECWFDWIWIGRTIWWCAHVYLSLITIQDVFRLSV